MFTIDTYNNFWGKAIHIFGNIYYCITPMKKKIKTYFIIFDKKSADKTFYRITDNFFIEKL